VEIFHHFSLTDFEFHTATSRMRKVKGKVHPRIGHDGPERE